MARPYARLEDIINRARAGQFVNTDAPKPSRFELPVSNEPCTKKCCRPPKQACQDTCCPVPVFKPQKPCIQLDTRLKELDSLISRCKCHGAQVFNGVCNVTPGKPQFITI